VFLKLRTSQCAETATLTRVSMIAVTYHAMKTKPCGSSDLKPLFGAD